MNIYPFLADSITFVGGSGLVHNLLVVLVVGIACGLIWWAGTYFIGKFGLPAIAKTLWDCFFVLILVIVAVNCLLSLIGLGFFKW
jgi:hypothetical protein